MRGIPNSRTLSDEGRFGCGSAPFIQKILCADPHGYQLWIAVGILHGLNRVLRCKSTHHQGQLAVGCRLDWKSIDPQHILRSMRAAAVHFHNKLNVFHGSFLFLSIWQQTMINKQTTRRKGDNLSCVASYLPLTQTSPRNTPTGESIFR